MEDIALNYTLEELRDLFHFVKKEVTRDLSIEEESPITSDRLIINEFRRVAQEKLSKTVFSKSIDYSASMLRSLCKTNKSLLCFSSNETIYDVSERA